MEVLNIFPIFKIWKYYISTFSERLSLDSVILKLNSYLTPSLLLYQFYFYLYISHFFNIFFCKELCNSFWKIAT